MITITGATGNVGTEAVRLLAAAGKPVRGFARRSPTHTTEGVDMMTGDLDDPLAVAKAVEGASTVILVSPAVPRQEMAVIDAAVAAGVGHLVKISSKASPHSPVDRRRGQAVIEAHLRESGLPWTLVRANAYMQNIVAFAPSVRADREIVMSAGDGEVGMIDAHDVAAVVAVIARNPAAHIGRTYWPTGPALLTYDDVADALSDIVGQPVTHRSVDTAAHLRSMLAAGLPEQVAQSNADAFRLIGDGDAAWITDDVEVLTGSKPRTVRDFLSRNRAAFV
ncbi:hypothetical protein ASG84_23270 [Rhodococcus sp. Leaf278]|uniref:NmrA family NAD(P)-binding protein n=1 Tax=Rhodococcus sp. Leaf278 TaxID=1736319 RepID=UPI00070B10A9|nr:NmrA family NAD(P)-binding protein [Rhodococcus sp. Leaf278]KQU53964.1 hypothetical protein ASG84_23270 [Rhodococcus sp. Leaf278]